MRPHGTRFRARDSAKLRTSFSWRILYTEGEEIYVARAFLIVVLLFAIALIAVFVFPPQRLVEFFTKGDKKP
jgi:hypothetical protein